jgi:hypothetical protein
MSYLRHISCVALLALLAMTPAADLTHPAKGQPEISTAQAAAPIVRLRKLHLVRPDLIPYPIAYEICC